MDLRTFDFFLPPELIAQVPLVERSASRLFFYDRARDTSVHEQFTNIVERLGPGDVLVMNNSRVIRARLRWDRYEIFLGEPAERVSNDPISCTSWYCLVKKGKFFHEGREVLFPDGTKALVESVEKNGLRKIRFTSPDFNVFLERCGSIPLPPYIRSALSDEERYQTVFAKPAGSVAAPTAGLHFTPAIFDALREKGVQIEFITLHVGLGTFIPVKADQVEQHVMHREFFTLSPAVAERLNLAKKTGKKITAVGTTALRTLESCANPDVPGMLLARSGTTDLFLYPPAPFRIVDHLFTNFHLPKSTLVMLISAFLAPSSTLGINKVQDLYAAAIRERYRFFSFGDAMLIW